ncbi:MAG: glycosyltransferase family 4 protein [Syntrophales bacterium]|nr:glycosyltransferase family 4 protein [Syntrophales bacterium]
MRILMFGWEFPPYISGGLGTACFGITKGLTEQGNEVIFVLPTIKDKEVDVHVKLLSVSEVPFSAPDIVNNFMNVEWKNHLEIRALNSSLRPYMNDEQYHTFLTNIYGKETSEAPIYLKLSGDYGPNLLAEVVRFGRAARSIAEEENFDIIHGHDWTSVFACVNAKMTSGRPYIYHAHALEFDRSGENINRIVYDIEKYGMEIADHVIAVSYYTKNNIINRYGIAPEKITVVHNAVSRSESEILLPSEKDRDEKIVLFLGRVTFQKGPDYFVEAAHLVLKNIPGVHFVMAGAGDMMPKMMERVAELQMGDKFRFTGFLRGEDVERMYAMSDLYVMPSVSEPFGISPLEAMLYDVPVIISKQSGVSEILHHALKVDFWNVRELADKMIALLRHPSIGDEMSERAREELKKIRWEYAAEKIVTVYRQVLKSS